MNIKSTTQNNAKPYIDHFEMEKQVDDLAEVICQLEENIKIVKAQGDNIEHEIKQIKIDSNKRNEESGKLKSIALFLAGSSVLTAFLIFCFKPMIDVALNTTRK